MKAQYRLDFRNSKVGQSMTYFSRDLACKVSEMLWARGVWTQVLDISEDVAVRIR